ncbi:MAG: TlpA disulfide reductase family protein [Acidobacteriota bacterium]
MKTLKSIFSVFIVTGALAVGLFAQTSLSTIDGKSVDIEAQKGKVVILAVGAKWLPLSGKQAEFTAALAKRYSGKDVVVYYIVTDSAAAKSKNFASNDDIVKFAAVNKLTVPVLRDADGGVLLKKYSIDQLPSFVILDKNGRQVGEAIGGIDPKFDITVPISKTVDGLL